MSTLEKLDGRVHVGDLVQVLFDTGARGVEYAYGVVTAVGPKRVHVTWESRRKQRLPRNRWHLVELVPERAMDEARESLRRTGVLS